MNEDLRIKEILAERKMSIRGLAELMKVDPASLSRSLSGKMTLETLKKIAEALNVGIWELFIKSIPQCEIIGFVEYKGVVYRITSFEDLENILRLKQ